MVVLLRHNIKEAHKDLIQVRNRTRSILLITAANAIGKQGVKELSNAAPLSKDRGEKHLKKSFSYKVTTRGAVRWESNVEYAKMINDGTKPSLGGYINAIGKRYKKETRRSKKLTGKLKYHPGVRGVHYIEKAAKSLTRIANEVVITALKRAKYLDSKNRVIVK